MMEGLLRPPLSSPSLLISRDANVPYPLFNMPQWREERTEDTLQVKPFKSVESIHGHTVV
jgi:hypothetical protein